jgi:hypothetical protein
MEMLDLTFSALVVHRAIYAAAELKIPDLLADHSRSSDEIAEATGCDADATYRLMRALASAGVLAESVGRMFELTELARTLVSDAHGSMRDWVLFSGSSNYVEAWQDILDTVRTGEPAWDRVRGVPFFDYLKEHPEDAALFDRAMTSLSSWEVEAVLETMDFSAFPMIVDIGGGEGRFLASILKTTPRSRGVIFDQPATLGAAQSFLARAGLAGRCDAVAGDFFASVPAGGDAYLLKYIVHDWDDEAAINILRNCRTAMTADASIFLFETVIPGPEESHLAKLQDLEMLLLLGSRERTVDDYRSLLARADLVLTRVMPTRGYLTIIEAQPRS